MCLVRKPSCVSFVIQQALEDDLVELLCALSGKYRIFCYYVLPSRQSVVRRLQACGIKVRRDDGILLHLPEPQGGDYIEFSFSSSLPTLPTIARGRVCVFTGIFFPSVLFAWETCRMLRKPIILATTSAYGWEQHPRSRFLHCMKKRLISSCSAVIVQGRRGEKWAQSYGVPNNKILRPFKPIWTLFRNRPRAPRKNIVLFVGRLVKQKGIEHLIRSFTDVSAKFPSAKLYIVGDGPEANNLKRLATKFSLKKRVRFLGWVGGRHLASLYAQSRVFVLPSEYELSLIHI